MNLNLKTLWKACGEKTDEKSMEDALSFFYNDFCPIRDI